jgi:hypothetical protein
MKRLLVITVLLAFPFHTGCAASTDEGADESDLQAALPIGTYQAEGGPDGSFNASTYDRQTHVMQLTVLAGNAYRAQVFVEYAQTQANPFFPWLTYRSTSSETVLRSGTLRATTWQGKPALDFGSDVGTFTLAKSGPDIALTSIAFRSERTMRLSFTQDAPAPLPGAETAITFACTHRNVDRGNSIAISLDREGRAGTAVVKLAEAESSWPKAGRYTMNLRATFNGWSEFDLASGTKKFTLRFPEREFKKANASFDGAGATPIETNYASSGDYHLSLSCRAR